MKLKNGWTSYEKENFKKGEEYWCFYMGLTNKGNALRNLNGVSLYKCTESKKTWYKFDEPRWDGATGFWTGNTEFELISGKEIYHAYAYMNGYGSAYCHFFKTEQDAKDGFDELIVHHAKDLTVQEQNKMYKKMFGEKPGKPKEEIEAMAFYNNLCDADKEHVQWLKEYGQLW